MTDPDGSDVSDGDVPTSEALDVWLDRLAQADGAPGGGAACGVMLAVAAALLRMVALYTSDDERRHVASRARYRRAGSRGENDVTGIDLTTAAEAMEGVREVAFAIAGTLSAKFGLP